MRLVHIVLSSLMLSLGIGCMVAADPGGESDPAGEAAAESAAGAESVGESSGAIRIGGGKCGDNVCGPGTYCCNSSCGICAPLGGACTQQYCAPVK